MASEHPKEVKTREGVFHQALTGAGTGNLRFENEKLVVTPMFRRNGHISTPPQSYPLVQGDHTRYIRESATVFSRWRGGFKAAKYRQRE